MTDEPRDNGTYRINKEGDDFCFRLDFASSAD
jgi:hypothetical protein